MVSIGSGIFPVENLGKTDAQKFLYFGKHWLKAGSSIKATAKSLVSLLTTAVSDPIETSVLAIVCQERCQIDKNRTLPFLSWL